MVPLTSQATKTAAHGFFYQIAGLKSFIEKHMYQSVFLIKLGAEYIVFAQILGFCFIFSLFLKV